MIKTKILLIILSILLPVYSRIDFDISLGKNSSYFGRFYLDYLSSFDNPKSCWAEAGTHPSPIRNLVKLCKELYKKNYTDQTKSNSFKIPFIIHQIWLGSPVPQRYSKWISTWQNIPGWKYKLWTDEDVKKIKMINHNFYNASKNYGERADILRMEILYQFGGVYVDIDFECIRPELFSGLNKNYDFYAGLHPLDSKTFSVVNALIGAKPEHPIILDYIQNLKYQKSDNIVIKTGPGLFTKAIIRCANKDKNKDIIFPPTFFYPLGNKQLAAFEPNITQEIVKKYVNKPETLAIHWWESNWEKPVSKVK